MPDIDPNNRINNAQALYNANPSHYNTLPGNNFKPENFQTNQAQIEAMRQAQPPEPE